MRWFIVCLFTVHAAYAFAASDTLLLDAAQSGRLAALPTGASLVVDDVPDGFGGSASLRFERIEVYAAGARVVVVGASGEQELPHSRRIHLIGASADGSVRANLAFDPDLGRLSGFGSAAAGAFSLSGERDGGSLRLRARPTVDTLPAGVVPQIVPSDDALPSGRATPDSLTLALSGTVPNGNPRAATVAIDTDNEFMSRRFSNDTTAATDWIGDLFGAMNVMYQRDLNVRLQIGNTNLRTAPDPYTQSNTPADQADLGEFGTYWQNHYGNIPRSFAILLSGKSTSGNSASGIAWINAYCETQSQGGSYSVNQIFTNSSVPISYSALIVGHEIGHNFGAYHTHCTNSASGAAPTASNTIDKCYSGESACYSGATSCPTSGPGAPAGTLMSYCNLQGCGGGANVLQFHPTQINTLSSLISQNAACFAVNTDTIFSNGFE
ncbi:MAG: M12 family metallo-peptidase [Dokdonella sp.]